MSYNLIHNRISNRPEEHGLLDFFCKGGELLIKRVITVVVCFVLFAGFIGSYSAIATDKAEERYIDFNLLWENAATISLDMTFANGTITSTGRVNGQNGTTTISATFVIARRNANGTFSEVDRWTARNGSITMLLSTSRTTRNQSAGTYRLSVTASVTRNGRVETVTGSHSVALR